MNDQVICPHCEEPLGFEDICWNGLRKKDNTHAAVVYYCPKCRKILGIAKE